MTGKRFFLIIMTVLAFFWTPIVGNAKGAQTQEPWTHLTDLASEISQSVDNGDTKAALVFVQAFSKAWKNDQKTLGKQLTDLKVRTLTASLDNLQNDLQTQADPIKLKKSAVEFQLVVDALSGDGTPIWKSMGGQILTSFNTVEKDIQTGNDLKFQVDLNTFLDLIEMVYPSMAIDVNRDQLAQFEGNLLYLTNTRMTYIQNRNQKQNQAHVKQINSELKVVFQLPGQSAQDLQTQPIQSMVLFIGTLIILTLLYVSWRKYKGTTTSSN